jgi:hypothetical protein
MKDLKIYVPTKERIKLVKSEIKKLKKLAKNLN